MRWDLASLLPPDFRDQLWNTLVSVTSGLILFLVAVLITFLGWLVALALSRGAQALLALVGVDASVARLQPGARGRAEVLPSRIGGYVVYWSTFLAACVVALKLLGLDLAPSITARLQDVVPRVLTSALVLVAGVPIAIGVARVVGSILPPSSQRPSRFRYQVIAATLIGVVILIALDQLGLAAHLVMALGVAVVAAAGLGLALAFGLGCRDLARDLIVEYLRASDSDASIERP